MIVNDHSKTFLNISKVFFKNLKKHKFALISETVRDRAKRTKIGVLHGYLWLLWLFVVIHGYPWLFVIRGYLWLFVKAVLW